MSRHVLLRSSVSFVLFVPVDRGFDCDRVWVFLVFFEHIVVQEITKHFVDGIEHNGRGTPGLCECFLVKVFPSLGHRAEEFGLCLSPGIEGLFFIADDEHGSVFFVLAQEFVEDRFKELELGH